jgi:hypothetical protein
MRTPLKVCACNDGALELQQQLADARGEVHALLAGRAAGGQELGGRAARLAVRGAAAAARGAAAGMAGSAFGCRAHEQAGFLMRPAGLGGRAGCWMPKCLAQASG